MAGHASDAFEEVLRRRRFVQEMRVQGKSVKQIAQALAVSEQVVDKQIRLAHDSRFADESWLNGLPFRVARALQQLEYRDRESVLNDVQSGALSTQSPGFGKGSMDALLAWLGTSGPAPTSPTERQRQFTSKVPSTQAIAQAIALLKAAGYEVRDPAGQTL